MWVLSVDVATKTEAPDGAGTSVQHELSAYIHCFKYYASPWVAKCDREDSLEASYVSLKLPLIIRPFLDVLMDLHGLVSPTCEVKISCDAISWDIEGPAGLRIASLKRSEKKTGPIDIKDACVCSACGPARRRRRSKSSPEEDDYVHALWAALSKGPDAPDAETVAKESGDEKPSDDIDTDLLMDKLLQIFEPLREPTASDTDFESQVPVQSLREEECEIDDMASYEEDAVKHMEAEYDKEAGRGTAGDLELGRLKLIDMDPSLESDLMGSTHEALMGGAFSAALEEANLDGVKGHSKAVVTAWTATAESARAISDAWAREVLRTFEALCYATMPERDLLEYRDMSLMAFDHIDADVSAVSLQWVHWDDVSDLKGRLVQLVNGCIRYTGPQLFNQVQLKPAIDDDKVRFIVKSTGAKMVKARGIFRESMVPAMIRLRDFVEACGGLRIEVVRLYLIFAVGTRNANTSKCDLYLRCRNTSSIGAIQHKQWQLRLW